MYLSKPIEYLTPRVNYSVNSGLGVIMVCQCRFVSCNRCPTLLGDIRVGGGSVCLGQEIYANSLYFLFCFALELKLL